MPWTPLKKDNPSLERCSPRKYLPVDLDPTNLGGLIDLIANIALGDAKARSAMFSAMCLNTSSVNSLSRKEKRAAQFYPPAVLLNFCRNA
jgi:type I restriction enzyme M protein